MAQILPYVSDQKIERIENISSLSAMQGNPREAALIGYLAGIMDGEGTIGIKKYMPKGENRTMCYYLYLSMGMQDKGVVDLFYDVLGGSIRKERVQRLNVMWRWNATGKVHVSAILEMLLPHLRVKKEQALLALHCCKTWSLQQTIGHKSLRTTDNELLKREEAYQQMRKLKHQEHPQRLNELARESVKR